MFRIVQELGFCVAYKLHQALKSTSVPKTGSVRKNLGELVREPPKYWSVQEPDPEPSENLGWF